MCLGEISALCVRMRFSAERKGSNRICPNLCARNPFRSFFRGMMRLGGCVGHVDDLGRCLTVQACWRPKHTFACASSSGGQWCRYYRTRHARLVSNFVSIFLSCVQERCNRDTFINNIGATLGDLFEGILFDFMNDGTRCRAIL